ncbi:hypothetical protein BH24CHL5_BH24CHL5_13100 [soil metagenome]
METLTAGSRFGPYLLERRLGAGGLAEVWLAADKQTGARVALKVFNGTLASADAERLRAEVELLATHALGGHPNVVEVVGGGPQPQPHVVMEYLDGGDLGGELSGTGRLSVERTLTIGAAVARALDAASEAGIVHGDIKPSNVLLGADGQIKLADFNVARVAGYSGASVSANMLSIAYAAPEVFDGRPSAASDAYALGCLLYECLSGTAPFRGSHPEVFRAHLERAPDLAALPDEVPGSLRRLIGELLAKDPAQRPSGARVVAERLSEIAQHAPDQNGAPDMPAALGPWQIESAHPTTEWAWRARHEETGQLATLELFFGDHDLAERLRRAVAVNEQLVAYGAERLLGTNRLLLRPGERLGRLTPVGWVFWVARDEQEVSGTPAVLDGEALAAATEQLHGLLAAAVRVRIALDLSSNSLVVLPNGALHLRRPGLTPGAVNHESAALATIARHVAPALVPVVQGAGSIGALAASLGRAEAVTGAWPAQADSATVVLPAATPAPPVPPVAAAAGAPPSARPGIRMSRDRRPDSGPPAALLGILGVLIVALLGFVAIVGLAGSGPAASDVGQLPSATPDEPAVSRKPRKSKEPVVIIGPSDQPTLAPLPTEPLPTQPPPTDGPTQTPPVDTPQPAPQGWSVDLRASQTEASNGERVNFTATANRNVRGTGWYIQIFNPDTGFVHIQCGSGRRCSVGGRRENITAAYQARISRADGSDAQAVSERIEVTWR